MGVYRPSFSYSDIFHFTEKLLLPVYLIGCFYSFLLREFEFSDTWHNFFSLGHCCYRESSRDCRLAVSCCYCGSPTLIYNE